MTDEISDVRRSLEQAVLPRATSIDGRTFFYLTAVDHLSVPTGGYIALEQDGATSIAQITAMELTVVDGPNLDASTDTLSGRVQPRLRLVRVEGRLLTGLGKPFPDAAVRAATNDEIAAWLDAVRPPRAALGVGSLSCCDDLQLTLDAGGFARHTFLCGQSGSGKTYALGTILERLLAETSLRIVILDPNSDFVRLHEPRDGAHPAYAAAAGEVVVRRPAREGADRLHVRFRDFSDDELAATLRLDPVADREEYAALLSLLGDREIAEAAGSRGIQDAIAVMQAAEDPLVHGLGTRARALGVDRWPIWSAGDADSLQDLVGTGGPRCLVVDLGSLQTPDEQAVTAEAVLGALWRRRADRDPTLVVIDEAHNVCPAVTDDPLVALATEHAVKIAAEGRKFGLTLLVSTQRPQKVHENIVSQCDNLVLMRLNSRSDLAALSELFSFVPAPLLALATEFPQGEAIVAGKLVASPTLARIGPRWSHEGGADPPSDWASAR